MDRLASHRTIAFDLDGTLIDGAASAKLASYIKEHPEKTFYVVTFRTPDQINTVSSELQNQGLDMNMFEKVVPMPARMVMEFDEDQRTRRNAGMPPMDKAPPDSLFPGELKLVNWKGFVTRRLGATVLVDDMPYLSAPGAKRFGVELIDAATIASSLHESFLLWLEPVRKLLRVQAVGGQILA